MAISGDTLITIILITLYIYILMRLVFVYLMYQCILICGYVMLGASYLLPYFCDHEQSPCLTGNILFGKTRGTHQDV